MLLWLEGFEEFAAASGDAPVGLSTKYVVTAGALTTLQTGRTQGLSLRIHDGATNSHIQTPSMGNLATWIVGFGFKPGGTLSSVRVAVLQDGGTEQFAVYMTSTGQIEARRGATVLATSAGTPFNTNTWSYVEFKVTIHNTTGSYELRVNGVNELSAINQNTRATANNFAQTLRLWGIAGGLTANSLTFDDWYIADTNAGQVADFIGSHRCVTINPNAEGDTNNFTPSAGTDNSAMVDETPHDTDTTYVESGTNDHLDLYQFENPVLTGIKGLQVNVLVRETDVTPFSVELVSKTGATTSVGTAQAVGSTTYVNRHRVMETDPNTAAAWTDANVDAAQFGLQVNI